MWIIMGVYMCLKFVYFQSMDASNIETRDGTTVGIVEGLL